MAGSTIGKHFQITTWGESHGKGIGVVINGCPAGLPLDEADIQKFLDRRKPGQSRYATARKEGDKAEILSGVFKGRTTGTPVSLVIFNQDQRSRDYGDIATYYRPGHADYTFDEKYGFRDYRGGGRSSGRETAGRVAAGAVAVKILNQLGISFLTYSRAIGPVSVPLAAEDLITAASQHTNGSFADIRKRILSDPLYMPDSISSQKAQEYLEDCLRQQDSAGGIVEGIITGVPAGIGEPVFDKLDANLAKAMFSIGAVKGFEIGDGFAAASAKGSQNNDAMRMEHGKASFTTNHAGGILGGISNGAPIIFRTAFKPTPSIASTQQTVNNAQEDITIAIHGRHDPIIVPRAVVVVECMAALTVLDLILENTGAKMENLETLY
ncbi:MAG: chorismate synthase [Lachnospiraceae bacterium]|nr:chorismate synthase [Lachnospiraceae bacterium]